MFKKTCLKKLNVSTLLFSLMLIALPAYSSIQTINSMQEVEKYVDKQTLVIFDLDHTIFEGNQHSYGHANWFYDQIEKGKAQGLSEKIVIFNIFPHWLVSQQNAKVKPVEALTPGLIKKLQKKASMVMGLSARQVPLTDITLKQLQEINIDFTSVQLPDEMIHQFNAPTLMKGGIIFCSEYNDKGEVLHAYLDKLNIKPSKIVFIDDSMRHLHSITKAYANQAQVIALHYPLVAESKKKHWDAQQARDAYCEVYQQKQIELQDYPLNCET